MASNITFRSTRLHVSGLLAGLACAAFLTSAATAVKPSWRYFRPGNTGIQGDYCEAVWIAPDGDPYIGGYDPIFEEGGFSKFLQAENRWVNFSNIDYPVIGDPNDLGASRVSDIVPDATGKLWMAMWRGAMTFDPALGASSLVHIGPESSALTDDRVWDIDRAPDGTMWFVNNGIVRYNPATDTWTRWETGEPFIAVQPKPTGGYLVWSSERPPFQSYTLIFDSDTQQWTILDVLYPFDTPDVVVGMPGKDCVDEAGNFWALRSTSAGDYDSLDYRRMDGTWVTPSEPYYGVTFSISAFKAYGDRRALLADGNGIVYQFNGSTWVSLGQGASAYSIDIDAAGNVWVSGVGGAAKRNVLTGQWQRYRITNTGNIDSFNRDLAIDPANGRVYAGANAAPGVGGMVSFDGTRWTNWNQLTYGLGHDWPFPNDYCHALAYRPSSGRIAVSPLNWLYGIHEWTGTGFSTLMTSGGAETMCEDSFGRLWALGEYFSLQYLSGSTWTQAGIAGWGSRIQPDPDRPGTIWAATGYEVARTDGAGASAYRFSRTIADFPELTTQSDHFSGLAVDHNGIAWIGSTVQLGIGGTGGGLIRLDSNTGTYQMLRYDQGWPLPGRYVAPLAVTPDGRVWMSYAMDFDTPDGGGLCWYDGAEVGVFPGPLGGVPQWGGLPHSQIADLEVRVIPGGYELWMSCVSRGIAALTVITPSTQPADLNGDGHVNGIDLALLLGTWTGAVSYSPCPPHQPADLNQDCRVNGLDLAQLLAAWG